ncbi:MAG: hypothetical protein V7608_4542 [Hyphomicrobiales bacterium]|jgi:hypothetical protein
MELLFTVLASLAFAGALASWIAGAVFYARTLRTLSADGSANWLAVAAWPLALSRIKGAGGEGAALVNKSLVAFFACLMIAFAAFSVSANLHRVAK